MNAIPKASLLLFSILLFTACNSNNTNNTTGSTDTIREKLKDAANNLSDAANKAGEKMKAATTEAASKMKGAFNVNTDSGFVINACRDNNKELRMIQAALNKATSKQIKADAHKMQSDHKALAGQIASYAASHNYTLPANDDSNAGGKIDDMSNSNDWDKSWVDEMVNDHQSDIDKFEHAKDNVKDAELRNLILNTLPVLRSHYDMMKELQDKMSVK